jgi:nucleotide-binding universal stress UspA family protein
MSRVLVAAPPGRAGVAVRAVGAVMAEVVQARVRRLVLRPGDRTGRDDANRVLAALRKRDVLLSVVPRGGTARRGWQDLVRQAGRPVVLVPERPRPARPAVTRVLVPLDGTDEAAAAVAETVQLCAKAGADVVALHVFDAATVPRFWDQAAHARRCWEDEFLIRHCAVPGVRLHLCSGTAAREVVDVAAAEDIDLIALGWSRRLDRGRARTVRRTVAGAAVPVLLVPLVRAG